MRTRLIHGDSNFNNSLTLEEGSLTVDTEKKALRFHLEGIQGGFEVPGQRAYTPPPLPGPQVLLHGDEDLGFYGEVPTSELIDGVTLASHIGLSAGTAQHSTQPWLKFAHQGRILYVAKRPYRHSVSWNHIHARGAVFGTPLTIGEHRYQVRLLTGGASNPASSAGGEWNDLIYPVHVSDPTRRNWGVNYGNGVMGIADNPAGSYNWQNGRGSWVQETSVSNANNRVRRGYSSLVYFAYAASSNAGADMGWRPVLEFQPPE